jgi:hypothetical protein
MDSLKKHIKECRPKLSDSSVKTYANILSNLHKVLFKKDLEVSNFIKYQDLIMDHLKDIKYNVRKTILSALVCITEGKEAIQKKYRDQMLKDANVYNAEQKTNTMTNEQKESWIDWNSVIEHMDQLKRKYLYVFKESKPSITDILNLQKYIVLSCYVLIPPRRCLDYCEMKYSGFDKEKENYFEKGSFVFQIYKTAKFLGKQVEKLPNGLSCLIRKWISFRPHSEYLFTDQHNNKLTSNGMTKILNSIFGKNVSVNQLRHTYITEKMGPLIKKLDEVASDMGHSVQTQKLYVKDK